MNPTQYALAATQNTYYKGYFAVGSHSGNRYAFGHDIFQFHAYLTQLPVGRYSEYNEQAVLGEDFDLTQFTRMFGGTFGVASLSAHYVYGAEEIGRPFHTVQPHSTVYLGSDGVFYHSREQIEDIGMGFNRSRLNALFTIGEFDTAYMCFETGTLRLHNNELQSYGSLRCTELVGDVKLDDDYIPF